MGAYQFKITIRGSKPPIWRRILVPDRITYENLHRIIQTVFCWQNYHLYEFEFPAWHIRVSPDGEEEQDFFCDDGCISTDQEIDELVADSRKFIYIYDFGDNWEHVIQVEKYVPEYPFRYAQVVKYKGDAIPEDCGGIWGYYELLDTLADPKELKKANKAYGVDYQAWAMRQGLAQYDMAGVNEALASMVFDEIMGNKKIIGKQGLKSDGHMDESAVRQNLMAEVAGMRFYFEELVENSSKSNLLQLAKNHCIKGVSGLKKKNLIQRIKEIIMSENYMTDYFSYMTDNETELFETIVTGKYYEDSDADENDDRLEYLYRGGYLHRHITGFAVITEDVREAYKRINTPEFCKLRRRRSFLYECLFAANCLYAITPEDLLLRMVNENGEPDLTPMQLKMEYDKLQCFRPVSKYNGNEYIDPDLLEGDEALWRDTILDHIPYYMPSREEIKSITECAGTDLNHGLGELARFLYEETEMDDETVASVIMTAHITAATELPLQELADMVIEAHLEHLGVFQKKRFLKLLTDVWANTRMAQYRGHTPLEASAYIPLGRPVLRLKGEKKDKVYPNDPCPCGSGKKYKQCCGRKP